MAIIVDGNQFQINTKNTSYVMLVEKNYLLHLYWGRRVSDSDYSYLVPQTWRPSFSALIDDEAGNTQDDRPLEYPCFGRVDTRTPALEVINNDGSDIIDAKYKNYEIFDGKLSLDGLPATYSEDGDKCQTLRITLEDDVSHVLVHLYYGIFEDYDIITRWTVIENASDVSVTLERAMSADIDFDNMDFDIISNHGSHCRERHIERFPMAHGGYEIESRRGVSSHTHNPYMILTSHNATETEGEAYGMALVYSGSFKAFVEGSRYHTARVMIGINPDDFGWTLDAGKTFTTPEVILSYSNEGLGGMSRRFHGIIRDRLCRGKYRNARRPIVLNSWEACYFDFDEDKLAQIGECAAKLGVEMLVVDDGWFGTRDDDIGSLGDWYVNKAKLPNGIEGLYKRLQAVNCKLGIWFEPEMVSPGSELYEKHPDWTVHIDGRPLSFGRHQFMLDLSRPEVREHIYNSVADVLKTGMVEYVKWDCNRNMSEADSVTLDRIHKKEFKHRYVLGLYEVLERLVKDFPNVLFESCSGGGGRFDCGMLYYMPQTWTSDNSDAIARLKIQHGTSLVYPMSAMVGHVSASPNHQTGHVTPFMTRFNVAYSGSFGYELDPTELSADDKKLVKKTAAFYKKYGDVALNGDYYRYQNPYEDNSATWSITSKDKKTVIVVHVHIMRENDNQSRKVLLQGLDPKAVYKDVLSDEEYTGAQLMGAGLRLNRSQFGEYASRMWVFRKKR